MHAATRWMPTPSHAFPSLRNGELSKAEGISCVSCVDNMERATFLLLGGVQDHQLKDGCFGE